MKLSPYPAIALLAFIFPLNATSAGNSQNHDAPTPLTANARNNMTEESETVFGKRILVGLTYLDRNGNIDRQTQLYGSITSLSENTLKFRRADNGEEFSIPFNGELDEADPEATYTLKSTGEVVRHIYFTQSWTINPPDDDHKPSR